MSRGELEAALPHSYVLQHMVETDSTMNDAQRWLEAGHTPRALFIADTQTDARGRRGRNWFAPIGNLYASLLIPAPQPAQAAGRFGFIISLAIHQAIADLGLGQTVTLKWPNDVLIDGAKVSGVLLERVDSISGAGLIIGFGVNIIASPVDTPYRATNLAAAGVTITAMSLTAKIMEAFWRYEALPLEILIATWRERAQGIAAPITVNLPNGSIDGIFRDLAADGALQLELADGSTRLIYNGDVFFR